MTITFRPRLFEALRSYTSRDFIADLGAGMTVAAVALPLAMAFAIASGLKPEAGLYTAIVAGLLISLLGGSRVQIGGPAGAYIVIVYGIVMHYGVAGLMISTLLAGVLLFLMGLFKWGAMIRFVPVAIVTGFTNGIAVLIALSQVKDVLGLHIHKLPSDFFSKIASLGTHLKTTNLSAVFLSAVCLLVLCVWPVVVRKSTSRFLSLVPASLLVLLGGSVVARVLHLPVETLGTQFGGIPSMLPALALPSLDVSTLSHLIRPAITIAILGAIESLLCARVADDLIGDRHDPNQELMAQGVANMVTPLFGGYCATGTIARTVTNIKVGGRTPVAGMVHAVTLLGIMMLAAPLAKDIPLCVLGAILLYVAYSMGEWHEFVRLRHFSNNYRLILLATFMLTVVVDLTVALEVGLGLSFLFFTTRIKSLSRLEPVAEMEVPGDIKLGDDVEMYRLYGSLFFGTVNLVEELMNPARPSPKVLILNLGNLLNLDTSGVEALENLLAYLRGKGSHLIITGANSQVMSLFKRSHFYDAVGRHKFYAHTPDALAFAGEILAKG